MNLFIVESPNKCAKIKSFLGAGFNVIASMGHIKEIPPKGMNIDIENGFEPVIEVIPKKKDVVVKIKAEASKADSIYLATDPDREGAAIAFGIYNILPQRDQKKCHRVMFNELTKRAIMEGLSNNTPIKDHMSLIQAQKARQVLDRLIGYRASNLCWALQRGTSAGRVQSTALRIICDRQKEINVFISEDFWYIDATLKCTKGLLQARVNTKEKDNRYTDHEDVEKDLPQLRTAEYKVSRIERKEKEVGAYPPFDTTSMQKTCSSLFGWSLTKTMSEAQHLYELGMCFLPGIRVTLHDGQIKKIEDIKESIQTFSLDRESFKKVRVTGQPLKLFHKGFVNEICYGTNQSFTVTSDHLFPVYDSSLGLIVDKQASEIISGKDFIVSGQIERPDRPRNITIVDVLRMSDRHNKKIRMRFKPDFKPLIKLLKGIILEGHAEATYYKYQYNNTIPADIMLRGLSEGLLNVGDIEKNYVSMGFNSGSSKYIKVPFVLSNDFFYFMGLIASDGHLSHESGKFSLLSLLKKNPRKIEIGDYVDIRKEINLIAQSLGLPPSKNLCFCCSPLKVLFEYMGFARGKKSATVDIPALLFNSGKDKLLSFIAGLWDGDGYFTIKKSPTGTVDGLQAGYTSKSQSLLSNLQIVLNQLGVFSYRHTDNRTKIDSLKISSYDVQKLYRLFKGRSKIKCAVYDSIIDQVHRTTALMRIKNPCNKPLSILLENEMALKGIIKNKLHKDTQIDPWNYSRGRGIPPERMRALGKYLQSDKIHSYNRLNYLIVNSNTQKDYEGYVYCLQSSNRYFTFDSNILTHNCTYIRTDSYNIAKEAVDEVRDFIKTSFPQYLPNKENHYSKKSSAAAQEAHEAIRPTHIQDTGASIDGDSKRLYDLIRDRFLACQMSPMVVDTVKYTIKASSGQILTTTGQTIKTPGWYTIYSYASVKDAILPEVCEGEELLLKDIEDSRHSTQPPAKFNEGSLAEKMEEDGIGRPATRAPIIKALQDKEYVAKDGKALIPTELGMKICDFLKPRFDDFFMDLKFTARLEEDLDLIADGKRQYIEVVKPVFDALMKKIAAARASIPKKEKVLAGGKCPVCHEGDVLEKESRFGKFYSCSRYPKCKSILEKDEQGKFRVKVSKSTAEKIGEKCPDCKKGDLLKRTNRAKGTSFIGCSAYPRCRYTRNVEDEK